MTSSEHIREQKYISHCKTRPLNNGYIVTEYHNVEDISGERRTWADTFCVYEPNQAYSPQKSRLPFCRWAVTACRWDEGTGALRGRGWRPASPAREHLHAPRAGRSSTTCGCPSAFWSGATRAARVAGLCPLTDVWTDWPSRASMRPVWPCAETYDFAAKWVISTCWF